MGVAKQAERCPASVATSVDRLSVGSAKRWCCRRQPRDVATRSRQQIEPQASEARAMRPPSLPSFPRLSDSARPFEPTRVEPARSQVELATATQFSKFPKTFGFGHGDTTRTTRPGRYGHPVFQVSQDSRIQPGLSSPRGSSRLDPRSSWLRPPSFPSFPRLSESARPFKPTRVEPARSQVDPAAARGG